MTAQIRSIHAVAREYARSTPDAVAVLDGVRVPLTYVGLVERLDEVRSTLNDCGIGRGDRVAVVTRQGADLSVCLLAVSASAVSAPLNPDYTEEEFGFYLADLRARALVVEAGAWEAARAAAERLGLTVLNLVSNPTAPAGTFALRGDRVPGTARPGITELDDIILTLYTSGTTARPKLVPLTQRNLLTAAADQVRWFSLTPADRTLAVMPLFHIQGIVYGLLAPVVSGGSIACPGRFDAERFFGWLDDLQPTWYSAGPTYHQALVRRARHYPELRSDHRLRVVRSASAPLHPRLMGELEDTLRVPVIESYGLTETCSHVTANPLPPGRRKPGTVGLPNNVKVAVIDASGRKLPASVRGEVVVAGPNVMAGYEKNPDANAEAFWGDYFRTGDLGMIDEHGYLTLVGRIKELINRGGEKIAPAEIDNALLRHPSVAEAVTFGVTHPTLGEEVCAAVVLSGSCEPDERDLKHYLGKHLSTFKIPRRILIRESLPKSAIGKIKRADIAEAFGLEKRWVAAPNAEYARKPTPLEAAIAALWSHMLGCTVGLEDDFFLLGGDSLQATSLAAAVNQQFGVVLTPDAVFDEAGTVAGMAAAVTRLRRVQPMPANNRSTSGPAPATLAQRSFWTVGHLYRDQPIHNVVRAIRCRGSLDIPALKRAVEGLIDRHEALRTILELDNGDLVQRVNPKAPFPLELFDAEARDDHGLQTLIQAQAQQSFTFNGAPLARFCLVRQAGDDHIILMVMNHAIVDGWSTEILCRELVTLYRAETESAPAPFSESPARYAEFAHAQYERIASEEYQNDLKYWRARLAGAPPPFAFPPDRARPEEPNWRGKRQALSLSRERARVLIDVGRSQGATLFAVLLAGFGITLYAATQASDIVLGVPVAARSGGAQANAVGCYMNTVHLRYDLSGNPSATSLIERVSTAERSALAHQSAPVELVLRATRSAQWLPREGAFPVLFQLRSYEKDWPGADGDPRFERAAFDFGLASSELSLEWAPNEGGLVCQVNYRTSLYEDATIEVQLLRYDRVLTAIARDARLPLSRLIEA